MNDAIRTQLSAYVDGELSEAEAGLLIRRLSRDPELRTLVAEYQAIGRLMREEDSLPGTGQLLGRIHAELGDEVEVAERPATGPAETPKAFRPMLGMAAAVAVAVLGVFSVSQFERTPDAVVAESYTVPNADVESGIENQVRSADSLNALMASFETQGEEEAVDDEDDAEPEEVPSGE